MRWESGGICDAHQSNVGFLVRDIVVLEKLASCVLHQRSSREVCRTCCAQGKVKYECSAQRVQGCSTFSGMGEQAAARPQNKFLLMLIVRIWGDRRTRLPFLVVNPNPRFPNDRMGVPLHRARALPTIILPSSCGNIYPFSSSLRPRDSSGDNPFLRFSSFAPSRSRLLCTISP